MDTVLSVRQLNHLLGERLRTLREASGLTQEELALQVGVDQAAVWRWETGRIRLPLGMAIRICLALQVPLAAFAATLPAMRRLHEQGGPSPVDWEVQLLWDALSSTARLKLLEFLRAACPTLLSGRNPRGQPEDGPR